MIGYIAAIVLVMAYTPQLISVVKTRKTDGISAKTYILLSVGLVLWCIHAVKNKDWALLISNLLSLVQSTTILLYLRNDKKS